MKENFFFITCFYSALYIFLITNSQVYALDASNTCVEKDSSDYNSGNNPYIQVTNPTLSPRHLEDLPGFTRSIYERDHALITPESQVYGPLLRWKNTNAAYFITPAMGAHFTLFIVQMSSNSSSAPPSTGVERFGFVIEGKIYISNEEIRKTELNIDEFFYVPANESLKITSDSATVIIIERIYSNPMDSSIKKPKLIFDKTNNFPLLPVPGEVFDLRKLLPTSLEYDFNIHVMDFKAGEYLNVKEVHYNQHGLILLEGRGVYRLAEKWYPVQAGDVIWMAPFVPQWYAALGKSKSRYLLYKDTNRDPLLFS